MTTILPVCSGWDEHRDLMCRLRPNHPGPHLDDITDRMWDKEDE